jgi:splicing factor 3A subunit 2
MQYIVEYIDGVNEDPWSKDAMDFQHREGGKTGTGGLLSASESNAERRERLRKLALETIDLAKDPYLMKNHLGSYECRLCLTLHVNEGSYLVHTQGKKHQSNLARRRAREASQNTATTGPLNAAALAAMAQRQAAASATISQANASLPRLGRPGYKIVKIRDPVTRYTGLVVQVHCPEPFAPWLRSPQTRLMSAFEQRLEPANRLYQYLLVAAPPYDTVALKIPAREIESSFSYWDADARLFTHQFLFKQQ